MSRYSMEIKALLERKKVSRSRFNPEASFNVVAQTPQGKTLKRCQSATSLRRKGDLSSLQSRYKYLQQNYQRLLDQTRARSSFQQKAKRQIQKLNVQHERDAKQIERLRSMLGFMPKKSISTQTSMDLQSSFVSGKSSQWTNKFEKSTQSGETSQAKIRPKLLKKTFINSPIRRQFRQSDFQNARSPLKSRSPTNRYRFVPTLPLK